MPLLLSHSLLLAAMDCCDDTEDPPEASPSSPLTRADIPELIQVVVAAVCDQPLDSNPAEKIDELPHCYRTVRHL